MTVGAEHRTLRELVADEILAQILNGELAPGTRLYEDRLASDLGVSRNPVREAIRILEATGLIEVIPRRGAYIAEIDTTELARLLAVRQVLEAFAAELAALNRTPDVVATLDRLIDEGREASASGDLVRAATCHRDFHIEIERASSNPFIAETVSPLRHRSELVFSMLNDSRSMLSWDEHGRIRDAIAAGDSALAKQRTNEHMTNVIEDLLARAASR